MPPLDKALGVNSRAPMGLCSLDKVSAGSIHLNRHLSAFTALGGSSRKNLLKLTVARPRSSGTPGSPPCPMFLSYPAVRYLLYLVTSLFRFSTSPPRPLERHIPYHIPTGPLVHSSSSSQWVVSTRCSHPFSPSESRSLDADDVQVST